MRYGDMYSTALMMSFTKKGYSLAKTREDFGERTFCPLFGWDQVYFGSTDNPRCIVRSNWLTRMGLDALSCEKTFDDLWTVCDNLITHAEELPKEFMRVVPIETKTTVVGDGLHYNHVLREKRLRKVSFPYKGDLLSAVMKK